LLADDKVFLAVAGSGAMATTYRARRTRDEKMVALKVPKGRFLTDPTFVVRFLQEAHLGVRLQNRFIVQVYEAGEDQGIPFLAMEFLHGMTLKEGLAASGRVSIKRALGIAHDVVSALDHAHANGVVHRDLKPENIMLRVGKGLKVMDFGIAKVVGETGLTSSNVFIGSPAYAAPEMINADKVDRRTDLYSLGIILFEMLQGEVPFSGASPVEVLIKQTTEPLPRRKDLRFPIPDGIWRLIQILAAKEPKDRLPDSRSVRIALELLLRDG
jgi:serine/threonine-protein kinase